MPYKYTRQRQGRDFSSQVSAVKEDEAKRTLINRLEQYKEEAERHAVPIDGNEPPERGR